MFSTFVKHSSYCSEKCQHVGIRDALPGVPRKQRHVSRAHDLFGVEPRREDALGANAVQVVTYPIEDLRTQVRHADRVRVRECQREAHLRRVPIARPDELVELAADVLCRLLHAWQEFVPHGLNQILDQWRLPRPHSVRRGSEF